MILFRSVEKCFCVQDLDVLAWNPGMFHFWTQNSLKVTMALRTIGYKLSVLIKRILYRKINCEYCRKAFDNFEIREKYIVEE